MDEGQRRRGSKRVRGSTTDVHKDILRQEQDFDAPSSVPDEKMARRSQEDELGADIIDECRAQLMLKFRFLDMALWRMELEPMRAGSHYPLATDGQSIIYDPPRVIARFQQSFDESVRDYLHMIMHCVFRHPYDKNKRHKEAWNLTCDIIVENAIMDLCGNRFKSDDDLARMMALSRIKLAAGGLSPAKIYSLIENLERTAEGQHYHGVSPSVLKEWRSLFERDDHGAWPVPGKPEQSDDASDKSPDEEISEDANNPDMESESLHSDSTEQNNSQGFGNQSQQQKEGKSENQNSGSDGKSESRSNESDDGSGGDINSGHTNLEPNKNGQSDEEPEGEDSNSQDFQSSNLQNNEDDKSNAGSDHFGSGNTGNSSEDEERNENARKDWEEISKQIEMNLHTFSKEWGEEAASLLASLQMANRKRHDYTEFLRRFMVVSEEMQLNMDEFDLTFYTFGMDMYGNMPFIEPLEYKETNRIREFVIVIDTSESVRGELVKKFLERTFDILKSSEDYSSSVNIHVIQADDKVQTDSKITDLKDLDRIIKSFSIRGFGGTDFRPAFDYVEMLIKRGELENLKGLIYFTDGFGQFPAKAPNFDAAFVFMDDGNGGIPPVPPWAIKVVLDEFEFEE